MFLSLIGIILALGCTGYLVAGILLRELKITLKWPAFLAGGLLVASALIVGMRDALFVPGSALANLFQYPALLYCLLALLYWGLGTFIKWRPALFYRRL